MSRRPGAQQEARGRVSIITGAARGIGRAIADKLAPEGARVVIANINGDGGRQMVAQHFGGIAVQADVRR